jgi:hypothetical protein
MKRFIAVVLAVVMVATLSGVALADKQKDTDPLGNPIWGGNGAPSGPHYNLNLIGMPENSKDGIDCGNGNRIFVKLGSKNTAKTTRILLQEAEDFAVLDCNGTDGEARFALPAPEYDNGEVSNTGVTEYSVFLRVVGKPNGKIKMATCATDPTTGEEICSDLQVIKVRTKGKQSFDNVSAELLYIYAWVCTDSEGGECTEWTYMRVPLFSDVLQDYLWKYDNKGVRIAQLRFYPGVSTTVPDEDDVPHLASIAPDTAVQGFAGNVLITGVNLDFDPPGTCAIGVGDVDFGADITVNSVSIGGGDLELTVNITIDGAASPGWRDVKVTLCDETELRIPFKVTS